MKISIIVPAYNEAQLIASTIEKLRAYLQTNFSEWEIIIVNDGSIDQTQAIVEEFIVSRNASNNIFLINNERNQGKGYSVSRGMLHAKSEICIFMDADLPFDLKAIGSICKRINEGTDIVIGDRNHEQSKLVDVHPIRRFAGKLYSSFVQILIKEGISDTQCGLKGFTADVAKLIFSRVTIDGFGFDVEILRIAQKKALSIVKIPVRMVNNRMDSKVHLIRDSFLMLGNLFTIKRNEAQGFYD